MTPLEALRTRIERLPRIRLVNLPTPLEEMARLTKILDGPQLWIKRDDCTGLAFGGNKERKMEFVMADALNNGADVVVTTGAVQSNHARSTAAAARKLGLKAILVLRGKEPQELDGNLLLDNLFGAEVRFVSVGWQEIDSILEETARELEGQGHTPYVIPGGASYPQGAIAYVQASMELYEQARERKLKIDCIVHAAGSGGTQAGLVLGNKALKTEIQVLGVSVKPDAKWLAERTAQISNETAKLIGLEEPISLEDVSLTDEYVGEGYGILSKEAREALRLVAQTEGILLDPVYTGKAMSGLIGMIKKKHFNKDNNVVFLHTGGTPALFAYKWQLRS